MVCVYKKQQNFVCVWSLHYIEVKRSINSLILFGTGVGHVGLEIEPQYTKNITALDLSVDRTVRMLLAKRSLHNEQANHEVKIWQHT